MQATWYTGNMTAVNLGHNKENKHKLLYCVKKPKYIFCNISQDHALKTGNISLEIYTSAIHLGKE